MANDLIAEISRLGLKDLNTPASASITDVEHLSSYNWIEAPKATPAIAVPGSPDLWSPPNIPFQLEKDTGYVYLAQNAALHPDSPLEPLFRALYVSHPSFDIVSIDVVTDRNNLRKLLAFVNPRWSGNNREAFTIKVEVTNNTAIFCREETKAEEYIGPNEFRGYGHSFEKECTSRKVCWSTRHHRIISYHFGGLKFVIRHETYGYVGVADTQLDVQPVDSRAPQVDNLSSVLGSLSLSPESSTLGTTSLTSSKLVIRKEGQVIPLSSTLEIKTRVAHRPLAFEDVVSQLWISQTPKLVRAYHTKGMFAVPEVEDVAAQVKAWEDQNQKDLKMLAGLIGKIRDIMKESGGRAMLRYDAVGDKLGLYRLEGEQMLPNDLYAKWEDRSEIGEGVDPDEKIVGESIKEARVAESGKSPWTAGTKEDTLAEA